MVKKRFYWFTIDLACLLSHSEYTSLLNSFISFWDFGTFIVIRTESPQTPNSVHNYLDSVLCESPLAVCGADHIIRILDRLEVHFNS